MGLRRTLAMLVLASVAMSIGTVSVASAVAAAPPAALPAGASLDSSYFIKNMHSGKCLQPTNPQSANSVIVQRTCGPWGGMSWSLASVGNGYYWLINTYVGMCMDLQANSEDEVVRGTLVQQFGCSIEYTSEQWYLRPGPAPSGHYQLVNRVKGLCADVTGRSSANNAKLQVIECKYNEPAQLFAFL